VLAFFGGGAADKTEDEYCKYCKASHQDKDCDTCSKKFEKINAAGTSKKKSP
jgi:hypothetical protein